MAEVVHEATDTMIHTSKPFPTLPAQDRSMVRGGWVRYASSAVLVLLLSACARRASYRIVLTTAAPVMTDIHLKTSRHTLRTARLERGQVLVFDDLYGQRPKTFQLTWTHSNGETRTCLMLVKDIYPTQFQFGRDGYRIDLQERGASLTFQIHDRPGPPRELGRLACCP